MSIQHTAVSYYGFNYVEHAEADFKEMLAHIYDQNQRIRLFSGRDLWERHIEAHREHLELIRYLRNGQKEEAVAALTLHLIKSKEAAIKTLIEKAIPVV